MNGSDVLGVLPTGYGKSLCFACLPWLFDRLGGLEEGSTIVVVSPLTAIARGISASPSKMSILALAATVAHSLIVESILCVAQLGIALGSTLWSELLTAELLQDFLQ